MVTEVKTDGIFKTGVLSLQYRLLGLIWVGLMQYLNKAGNFKLNLTKLTNVFQLFHHYLLGRSSDI